MNSSALLNRSSKRKYDLVDEYTFIDNIGSYIKKPNGWEGTSKAILLQRYLNALQLRVNWDDRDKDNVLDYLTKTLAMAKLSGDVVV